MLNGQNFGNKCLIWTLAHASCFVDVCTRVWTTPGTFYSVLHTRTRKRMRDMCVRVCVFVQKCLHGTLNGQRRVRAVLFPPNGSRTCLSFNSQLLIYWWNIHTFVYDMYVVRIRIFNRKLHTQPKERVRMGSTKCGPNRTLATVRRAMHS